MATTARRDEHALRIAGFGACMITGYPHKGGGLFEVACSLVEKGRSRDPCRGSFIIAVFSARCGVGRKLRMRRKIGAGVVNFVYANVDGWGESPGMVPSSTNSSPIGTISHSIF